MVLALAMPFSTKKRIIAPCRLEARIWCASLHFSYSMRIYVLAIRALEGCLGTVKGKDNVALTKMDKSAVEFVSEHLMRVGRIFNYVRISV